jgi:predicted Zn-dependent protease
MAASANALCFGDDLPGAGVPCRVEGGADGLSVARPDAAAEYVPFPSLTVSAGGFEHDQLVVKWAAADGERTLYLKDPEVIRALRQFAPELLGAQLEATATHVRRARSWHRTVFLSLAGTLVAMVLVFVFGFDSVVTLAVTQIPVEWEESIGANAQAEFLASQSVIKAGPAVDAVTAITARLAEQVPDNRYTFKVTVVRSDVVNAFALPGGYVVVFTGLLKKAEDPDEVAGVLAHELNHVLHRHGLERIVKTVGLVAVGTILLGDQQGMAGLAKRLGVELLSLKFGREQETEADMDGLRLLHRAKIPPQGMIRFFERLAEHDTRETEWMSTHPMSKGRAERLKAEVATLPKQETVPFPIEWAAMQASIS